MRKFIYITAFILYVILPRGTYAATVETLNKSITDINSQIEALDKEIKMYQDQIATTNQKSNTLSNLIKELTLTRNKLLSETKQTEKKITATNIIIGTLDNNITVKESTIDRSENILNKMLRDLREKDSATFVERIFASESIIDASREYNNILSINEKVRTNILQIRKEKEDLLLTKGEKQTEQQKLTVLKNNLVEKKLAVDITKKEKDTLLKETKNEEAAYKKLLDDRVKKRDAFEKDLSNYEAQLKFILNPSLLPSTGTGILSWPLDKVFVTQLFGRTVAAKRLYTSGSHSGVDFRASIGTPVKAMASGTVVGTGDTDIYCKGASFGKWVFIKYDNGLSSTFGHLSYISSRTGQRVSTGDTVALSGNTGHSTGPHLHVTVYASQGADVKAVPSLSCNGKNFIMPIAPIDAYLDPMLYLPKLSTGMLKSDTPRD